MDFSAFLVPDMPKENDEVKLKVVDEQSTDEKPRLIRLKKDTVEELDDQPAFKIGLKRGPEARLEAATRDELKIRSNDPDVGSLIEREMNPLEEHWDTPNTSQKKVPWGWLVVLGLIFSASIIWSLLEVNSSEQRNEELKDQAGRILEEEAEEQLAAEKMVEAIEGAVRGFHESSSIDEMVEHVRHSERVRPLMEDYYSRNPFNLSKVRAILALEPLTIENTGSLWMMKSTLESGEDSQLLIEVKNNDVAKVDWETFVCYQPMEWEKFVSERPSGYVGDFRVYVDRDHFYTYEFADSGKYASYRLTALNSDQPLYGYAPRESSLFKEIEKLLDDSNGSQIPMILKLRVLEDAVSKRGVLVEELVAPRWVYLKSPEADGQ